MPLPIAVFLIVAAVVYGLGKILTRSDKNRADNVLAAGRRRPLVFGPLTGALAGILPLSSKAKKKTVKSTMKVGVISCDSSPTVAIDGHCATGNFLYAPRRRRMRVEEAHLAWVASARELLLAGECVHRGGECRGVPTFGGRVLLSESVGLLLLLSAVAR